MRNGGGIGSAGGGVSGYNSANRQGGGEYDAGGYDGELEFLMLERMQ